MYKVNVCYFVLIRVTEVAEEQFKTTKKHNDVPLLRELF